jgi:hypothetical protein
MWSSTLTTPHSIVMSLLQCVSYLTLKLKSGWLVSRENLKIQTSRKETTCVLLLKFLDGVCIIS